MQVLYLFEPRARHPLCQILSILLLTPFRRWRSLLQSVKRLVTVRKKLQAHCNLARLMIVRVKARTWKNRIGLQLTDTGHLQGSNDQVYGELSNVG